MDGGVEGRTPRSGIIEMKPVGFEKDPAFQYNFDSKSGEDLKDFIKARMEQELGLIENPTDKQLEEIIHRNVKRKLRGKTVFFRDFIDEIPYEGADLSDSDIIDAEIIKEPIRIKSDNEL